MTLSSFIGPRPPEPAGVELMFMCTTVSTEAVAMTLPISGLRMSARTNSVRPSRRSISGDGGTVSTPMTRSMARSRASSAASAPPSQRLTPVTRTTAGGTSVSSLLVAALDAGLLQQLAVLLLRHPLAALLDDRTHVRAPDVVAARRPPSTGRSHRAPREVISSCATTRTGTSPGVARRPSVPGGPAATLRLGPAGDPDPPAGGGVVQWASAEERRSRPGEVLERPPAGTRWPPCRVPPRPRPGARREGASDEGDGVLAQAMSV